MEKRGALELSVNTIIVIVIGVTILMVGLAFIGNIRDKLFQASDDVFGNINRNLVDSNQLVLLVPNLFLRF